MAKPARQFRGGKYPPPPSDNVPLMGQDGEYVMNKEATEIQGTRKLDGMNREGLELRRKREKGAAKPKPRGRKDIKGYACGGKVAGYADGGRVPFSGADTHLPFSDTSLAGPGRVPFSDSSWVGGGRVPFSDPSVHVPFGYADGGFLDGAADWLGAHTHGLVGTSPMAMETRQRTAELRSMPNAAMAPTRTTAGVPMADDTARFRSQAAGIVGGYNSVAATPRPPAAPPAAVPSSSAMSSAAPASGGGFRQTSFGMPVTRGGEMGLNTQQAADIVGRLPNAGAGYSGGGLVVSGRKPRRKASGVVARGKMRRPAGYDDGGMVEDFDAQRQGFVQRGNKMEAVSAKAGGVADAGKGFLDAAAQGAGNLSGEDRAAADQAMHESLMGLSQASEEQAAEENGSGYAEGGMVQGIADWAGRATHGLIGTPPMVQQTRSRMRDIRDGGAVVSAEPVAAPVPAAPAPSGPNPAAGGIVGAMDALANRGRAIDRAAGFDEGGEVSDWQRANAQKMGETKDRLDRTWNTGVVAANARAIMPAERQESPFGPTAERRNTGIGRAMDAVQQYTGVGEGDARAMRQAADLAGKARQVATFKPTGMRPPPVLAAAPAPAPEAPAARAQTRPGDSGIAAFRMPGETVAEPPARMAGNSQYRMPAGVWGPPAGAGLAPYSEAAGAPAQVSGGEAHGPVEGGIAYRVGPDGQATKTVRGQTAPMRGGFMVMGGGRVTDTDPNSPTYGNYSYASADGRGMFTRNAKGELIDYQSPTTQAADAAARQAGYGNRHEYLAAQQAGPARGMAGIPAMPAVQADTRGIDNLIARFMNRVGGRELTTHGINALASLYNVRNNILDQANDANSAAYGHQVSGIAAMDKNAMDADKAAADWNLAASGDRRGWEELKMKQKQARAETRAAGPKARQDAAVAKLYEAAMSEDPRISAAAIDRLSRLPGWKGKADKPTIVQIPVPGDSMGMTTPGVLQPDNTAVPITMRGGGGGFKTPDAVKAAFDSGQISRNEARAYLQSMGVGSAS